MSEDFVKREIIGVYDRAAPLYDQVGIRQFTHFAKLLVNAITISPGARVLDVATGRGALLFAAAERTGPSGQAIGIDLAPSMVEQTRICIRDRGFEHVQVMLMDADEVAFAPSSFDVILCGFALHFVDYDQVLPKLLTLLKDDGCFAASFPAPPTSNDLVRWQWLFDLTTAVFPPDFIPPPAWTAPGRLNRPESAEAALNRAGFTNVRTEQHEATLFFKDEQDWWDWEWSQASRFWLEGMSPAGLARFKNEAFEHLEKMKEPQGISIKERVMFAFAYKPKQ